MPLVNYNISKFIDYIDFLQSVYDIYGQSGQICLSGDFNVDINSFSEKEIIFDKFLKQNHIIPLVSTCFRPDSDQLKNDIYMFICTH